MKHRIHWPVVLQQTQFPRKWVTNLSHCELGLGETDKLGRKDIKKLAVKIVTDKEITLDPVWRDFFAKNSKKDDLADSFLQAYTWCVDGSSWSDLMQID